MQALVTGASGFLGGRLVEMLRGRGAQVAVLARSSSVLAARPDVQLLRIDLDSTRDSTLDPQLVAALSAITHIFHCAGCSTDWAPTPQFEQSNVDGVAAMLRLAKAHAPRLKRFIHVSTTDVYGYPRVAGDETCLPHDVGLPYNSSKLRGEALVWDGCGRGLASNYRTACKHLWASRESICNRHRYTPPSTLDVAGGWRTNTRRLCLCGRCMRGDAACRQVSTCAWAGLQHQQCR